MALDRDLAVAFVRALGRRIGSAWETTAATGVRGLRLLRETDAFASFTFTESGDRSFPTLAGNVAGEPRAHARHDDGRTAPPGAPFDYVDVDPYGSPLEFLPAAFAALRPGGLLAVTATDLTVLAGAQPAACRRRYGSRPVRGRLGPEGALRILLAVLAREATARGRGVRTLLGYVGGHHVRAYVQLLAEGGAAPPPVAEVAAEGWDGPPLGGDGPWGPFWLGPIVDPAVALRLEVPVTAARPRELERLIARLRDDATVAAPFYYEPNRLASTLGLPRPPALPAIVESLRHAGHKAARTHVRPEGFRTDAPRAVVEQTVRRIASGA